MGRMLSDQFERVQQAIEAVEENQEKYTEVLTMYYRKRFTWEQIAEYYDVNMTTMYKRKIRLLNELYFEVYPTELIKKIMTHNEK